MDLFLNALQNVQIKPLLKLKGSADMICIWYPFECDMGLDGALTSHIERVISNEFDMACPSAI